MAPQHALHASSAHASGQAGSWACRRVGLLHVANMQQGSVRTTLQAHPRSAMAMPASASASEAAQAATAKSDPPLSSTSA